MNQKTYPLLTALTGRDPASYTGPDLSRLPIEIRGDGCTDPVKECPDAQLTYEYEEYEKTEGVF